MTFKRACGDGPLEHFGMALDLICMDGHSEKRLVSSRCQASALPYMYIHVLCTE
jgi:hypothetical protein